MKFRNGFVSNSSSSSFIVFVDRENVIPCTSLPCWLKKNRFEDHELWAFMEGGPDGDWFRGKLDRKILSIILDNLDQCENIGILIDPIWKLDDSWGFGLFNDSSAPTIEENLIGKIYEVMNIDYHGPTAVNDWLYQFNKINEKEYWEHYHDKE